MAFGIALDKLISGAISSDPMTVAEVIKHFGGVGATARALDIKQPSVSKWRKNKSIPYLRQLDIEKRTKGKLKAEGK